MKTYKDRLKGTNNFQEYYEKNSPRGKEAYIKRRKEEKKENKLNDEFLKEKQLERKENFKNSALGKTYIGQKVISEKKVNFTRKAQPSLKAAPMLSREQAFIKSFFGGGDHVIFNGNSSDSLPQVKGHLMPYAFGDETQSGTAETFGMGTVKYRSGLF